MNAIAETFSSAAALSCSRCGKDFDISDANTFADCCNKPLLVRYDAPPDDMQGDLLFREKTMWRYFELLPVMERRNIISLGEGMTPLLPLERLADRYGFADLLLKDESMNPTGSFKARGMSVAVSRALELGVEKCIVPTAGNAGGALAAYCAKAGIHCRVVMPSHTPKMFMQECELYGAELILVDGLINDCAKKVASLRQADGGWMDMSTLKEPYRLEGKKTMGYEIAEHLNWHLPDVIIYPAGGGTGLIGIWKAFREMVALGWIKRQRLPKMIAVQSEQCAPVVNAFFNPGGWQNNYHPKPSIANGLAVPYPFGMDMMQAVLSESGGTAIALSDEEIIEGVKEIAKTEGLLISPEGASTWMALRKLQERELINEADKIVLLNTGSGYKYLENLF